VTAGILVSGGFSGLSAFNGEAILVSEVVSASPLTMTVQLSAVSQIPNRLLIRAYYEGNAAHSVDVAIFNHTTSGWDSYGEIPTDTELRYYEFNIYTGVDHVSTNNAKVRFVHNAGGTNTHSFQLDYLALAKLIEGAGITNHGALQGLSDDDHLQYALADGTRGFSALSDIVSALSAVVINGLASAETARSTLSALVVSGIASVDGRATSIESRLSTLSGIVAGLGAASATSQEVSAQAASIASAKDVSLSATLRADYVSVANATSNTLELRLNSVVSAVISAIEVRVSTVSALVASVSARNGAGTSAKGLQTAINQHSNWISAVSNTLSAADNRTSLLSAALSTASIALEAHAAAASAAATSVGALLSAHNIQIAIVQAMQSVATVRASPMAAGMTVSGLSVLLAVSGLYTMDAMLIYSVTSAAQPFAVGLIYPAMANMGGKVETRIAVVSSDALGTQSTVNTRIGWWDLATPSGSMLISATGGTQATPVYFNGMFLVSTVAGKLKVMAAASSGASGGIHIMKGSYLRVYKIGTFA
jgi:hypothetical protein